MKPFLLLALAATAATAAEKQLFNGKDLTGWSGNPALWSVKDGVIVGKTSADAPIKGNTFLIWKDGEVSDFTLTLKYKMTPGDGKKTVNSGIQYRSKVADEANFVVAGYQADFEYGDKYSGILYEEKGRGILAQRGQKVTLTQGADAKKPTITVTGETGKSDEIQAAINKDGWNEYKIIAKGGHLQHHINGKLTVDVTDETAEGAKKGVLALQLHAGPPMQVEFKDIVLDAE
ncbi:DUF1080 domain-containing protein [Luteolibacter sp. SL250]|uniref:3-keto-disaccharide hydrolase n=1 Tax=Luteolibacter sp. SL250 TaxID=2995170 RepID=UPI0022711508|nr:DUF1080 domain-containing protein [Luteolibacter sp. SL250]WAC19790.1 DUF1080 domain-containing protein [Luteolibacter sp. SL250]